MDDDMAQAAIERGAIVRNINWALGLAIHYADGGLCFFGRQGPLPARVFFGDPKSIWEEVELIGTQKNGDSSFRRIGSAEAFRPDEELVNMITGETVYLSEGSAIGGCLLQNCRPISNVKMPEHSFDRSDTFKLVIGEDGQALLKFSHRHERDIEPLAPLGGLQEGRIYKIESDGFMADIEDEC